MLSKECGKGEKMAVPRALHSKPTGGDAKSQKVAVPKALQAAPGTGPLRRSKPPRLQATPGRHHWSPGVVGGTAGSQREAVSPSRLAPTFSSCRPLNGMFVNFI